MKTLPTVTLFVTLLAGPNLQIHIQAQAAGAVAAPRPPNAPGAAPAPAAAPGLPQVVEQVDVIIKDAARTANDAMRSALNTAQSALWESEPAFQFGSGAKSSSRSLAIQTTNVDPEKVDDIEEDLSVMARILQKAARSLREDERYNAMGIDVFGSASGARNLYVEGHGALFLLSVKYPLVGPANTAPTENTDVESATEWETTREEVLGAGPSHADHDAITVQDAITVFRTSRGKSEPYDEKKVAGLKLALLNALTNASNIRYLAPSEFVTVVVQGGDTTETTVKVVASSNTPGAAGGNRAEAKVRKESRASLDSRKSAPKGESVLSLRVKKADLDAIAAGRLTSDEFRQKATVLTYLRRGDTGRPVRR